MSRAPQPGFDDLAAIVQRLAVLLGAGIPPATAWGYLDDERAARVASAGEDVAAAIADAAPERPVALASGWRSLAAAWTVATDAGSPLGPTLRDLADSFRSLSATERAVRLALTSPKATGKVVLVLPLVGLLFGVVLGFDTVGVLVGTPVGIACLLLGALLMCAAWQWNRVLVRRATPTDAVPGIACDLAAIAVSAGVPAARARALASAVLVRFALPDSGGVDEVLALSERAGVPAVELLRASAAEQRVRAAAEAQRRAETLGVTLMLPLGVCVLPAFIMLGVVPMVIAVVTTTVGSLT